MYTSAKQSYGKNSSQARFAGREVWTYANYSVFLHPMKQKFAYKAVVVRFRRWSRKGYAIFGSLGKLVTIGRVCKSIADASQLKSGRMRLSECMARHEAVAEDDVFPPGETDALLLSGPMAVATTVAVPFAPAIRCEAEGCGSHMPVLDEGEAGADVTFYDRHACSADDARGEQGASSALHVFVPLSLLSVARYVVDILLLCTYDRLT